ncbi:MAG: hypothetical protein ACJ77K_10955 [Bacteroidia bacterium]
MLRRYFFLCFAIIISSSAIGQKDTVIRHCSVNPCTGYWIPVAISGGGVRTGDLEKIVLETFHARSGIDSLRDYVEKHISQSAKQNVLSFANDTAFIKDYEVTRTYELDTINCQLLIPGSNLPQDRFSIIRKGNLLALTNCTLDCMSEIYMKID